MFRSLINAILIPLALSTTLLFGSPVSVYDPAIQSLLTTHLCQGDLYGDFVNDFVAVLSDGSAWKVHPKDSAKYGNWTVNDIMHVQIRTSFYWFKREHKFELQNLSRNESVRVMLMQYPQFPLTVVGVHNIEIGGYYETIANNLGSESVVVTQWIPIYTTEVYLNDGSVWRLSSQSNVFSTGNYVYFGVHRDVDKQWNFLITGTQREAIWQKVARVM